MGRQPVFANGQPMLTRRVAFVLKPAVLRILLGQTAHILVTVGLGKYRGSRNVGIFAVALNNTAVGDGQLRTEPVSINEQEARSGIEPADRQRHSLERSVQDVDLVDARRRNRLYGPGDRLALDDLSQPIAVALGHLLRIVKPLVMKIRRKDHRRSKDRPGQTAAPGLIAPGLEQFVLKLVFQHRTTKLHNIPAFSLLLPHNRATIMKFDIARQPLIPAFLTLLALTAVAMWGAAKRPAAMPQSYSERIAFYLTAAKSTENEESAETAHAAEHTEAAAQPDHPAYNPTLAATGTQPQTTAANGPARDSLALPANPGTNQTIPAASAHTASPEQGTESLQTTHRDRQIAATDSTDTGNSGETAPTAPALPAPSATDTDSAANTVGKRQPQPIQR